MMRKGRRSKPPGVGICRVLMVVRRAGCVSFSPVSRLAQIGTVWSALETQPLWAKSGSSNSHPPPHASGVHQAALPSRPCASQLGTLTEHGAERRCAGWGVLEHPGASVHRSARGLNPGVLRLEESSAMGYYMRDSTGAPTEIDGR